MQRLWQFAQSNPKNLQPIASYSFQFFNLILSSEVFPTSWKTASVIPIHKTGSQTVVQNHRPIALLPLWKVFEKHLKHIYSYLEYHKLLIPNNSGFRKKTVYLNFIAGYLSQSVPSLWFKSLFKHSFPWHI